MSEQDLTPEQLEQLREQLASVPAGEVVAEAAVPLITMAQIRMGLPPEQHARFRDLESARVLVDALGGLLAATEGRLGAPEPSQPAHGLRRGGGPGRGAPGRRGLGAAPASGAGGLGHPAPAQRAVGPGPGLAAPGPGHANGPALVTGRGPANLA